MRLLSDSHDIKDVGSLLMMRLSTPKGDRRMWLTVAQLAQNLNKTERAVRKAISAGKYSTAKAESGRGRGGINWYVSAYDPAVPESVRRQLGIEERAAKIKKMKEAEQLTIKPEDIGDEMKQRLRVVRAAQDKPEGTRTADWYASISRRENVSVPTIYRWLKDAERGKVVSDRAPVPVALEASGGSLHISVSSRSFAPQAMEYGIALLMQNQFLDTKTAYMELAVETEKQGWEIGSMQSFYRAVASLPEIARIYTQRGKRGVEAIIKPYIERDNTKYGVYEELAATSTSLTTSCSTPTASRYARRCSCGAIRAAVTSPAYGPSWAATTNTPSAWRCAKPANGAYHTCSTPTGASPNVRNTSSRCAASSPALPPSKTETADGWASPCANTKANRATPRRNP